LPAKLVNKTNRPAELIAVTAEAPAPVAVNNGCCGTVTSATDASALCAPNTLIQAQPKTSQHNVFAIFFLLSGLA
jgi:hypothetical protein